MACDLAAIRAQLEAVPESEWTTSAKALLEECERLRSSRMEVGSMVNARELLERIERELLEVREHVEKRGMTYSELAIGVAAERIHWVLLSDGPELEKVGAGAETERR